MSDVDEDVQAEYEELRIALNVLEDEIQDYLDLKQQYDLQAQQQATRIKKKQEHRKFLEKKRDRLVENNPGLEY